MSNNENSLPMIFYLISVSIAVVGSIFGIFMIMDKKEIGIVVIIITVLGGIILFGLGKAFQFLIDIKGALIDVVPEQKNDSPEQKIVKEDFTLVNENRKENVTPSEQPSNERVAVEWILTDKQKTNIFEYYNKDNQKVAEKEILVSPFKGYCVVKTSKFVDVIELVNDQPITLSRDQVEDFAGLRQWIENVVFGQNK